MGANTKKILILGVSGMLGHRMWRTFATTSFQIVGTVRKSKDHYKALGLPKTELLIDGVDVEDLEKLKGILDQEKPDVVINCVGLTLRKKDLGDIEKCYRLNSMLPQYLGQWCNQHQAKLIHFSTDCVFDGKKGGSYSEADMPTAFDHYGQSKFLGEVGSGKNLTLRLSIVGRELENKTELIEWIFSQTHKVASGYANVFYTGLTTQKVASEVLRLLEKFPELSGVYQVSSEKISKYEIIRKLNEKFNLDIQLQKNIEYKSDKSLDSSRYQKATGFESPSWDDMIEELYQDRSFYERL